MSGFRLRPATPDDADPITAGFSEAMMGATLTGVPFYARHGYRETAREESPLPGGGALTVVHMKRRLG